MTRQITHIKFILLIGFTLLFFCRCQNHSHSAPKAALPNFQLADTIPKYKPTLLAYQLDTFFKNKFAKGGFNATVIVSKGEEVLYSGEFGYENFATKDTLTLFSPFQIASVSKPFTATAILYLVEQKKLSLDDTLGTFFPNFPYRKVRVRDLLSHRSGLPNYLHFGDKLWRDKAAYMSNEDLITLLKKNPAIEGTTRPNTHFQYCNTNYALLASIVERVTGKRFPAFMEETFFQPLGMNNTWVNDVYSQEKRKIAISYNSRWVPQKDDPYDGVYGDKGLYSCTHDMYLWNQAFYQNKLIGDEAQKEAYSPRSFERAGARNYGYGWRLMKQPNNEYLVYHNGWWHGNNTVYYRYLPDSFSLVILSNRYNRSVYNVQPIFDIISGKNNNGVDFGEE